MHARAKTWSGDDDEARQTHAAAARAALRRAISKNVGGQCEEKTECPGGNVAQASGCVPAACQHVRCIKGHALDGLLKKNRHGTRSDQNTMLAPWLSEAADCHSRSLVTKPEPTKKRGARAESAALSQTCRTNRMARGPIGALRASGMAAQSPWNVCRPRLRRILLHL